MRWENYILRRGAEFTPFWGDIVQDGPRDILFILGLGFDPRCCKAAEAILQCSGEGRRDVVLLEYDNNQFVTEEHAEFVRVNREQMGTLFPDTNARRVITIRMRSDKRNSVASQNAVAAIRALSADILGYRDVVLDMSAIPRVIALSAIAKLMSLIDERRAGGHTAPNLHVLVAESHGTDKQVGQTDLDEEVTPLKGFSGQLSAESTRDTPRVWLPILGENKNIHLRRIQNFVQPDEICPVIPSPSLDPRRGDRLVESYREILFDTFQVEPHNILHASEFNPFETYRQIFKTVSRYSDALQDLGGCKAFVSPLSSKLLSVGALLACYELRQAGQKIGIPYLEAQSYGVPGGVFTPDPALELCSMWLAGEAYES